MPSPPDKNLIPELNASTERCVPAEPKSFSPEIRDPAVPNAWERLRALSEKSPGSVLPVEEELQALARGTIKARQLRYQHLPRPMFGEPAWDMLLSLYVTSGCEAPQTVSNLCSYSAAPSTTALRWIDFLEREELVARRPNKCDLRVVFVELTSKGRAAIEAYLADLLEQKATSALRI